MSVTVLNIRFAFITQPEIDKTYHVPRQSEQVTRMQVGVKELIVKNLHQAAPNKIRSKQVKINP
jgi:hypothetical protein